MKRDDVIVGADIGGSHITAGLVDMKLMKVIKPSVVRMKLNSNGTANEILSVWISTLKQLIRDNNVGQIGFAMPGPFDYEKGICLIRGLSKYESLYDMNIRTVLSEELQLMPEDILFRNDAEAFLAGELSGGAAKGFHHAIGITLGTGLGTAISHNEIALNVEKGITPYKDTIIEEFVSTRGLIRMYYELTGKTVKDAKELADIAANDIAAQKTFELFSEHLTWFLEQFIETENPEVLVVGGNIANAWDLFMPSVIKRLQNKVSNMPVIVKAVLDEDAALIGGACCFNLYNTGEVKQKKLENKITNI